MDISQRILSDITVYMKYAKFRPELNRRETWEELVTRNMEMHIKKYPLTFWSSWSMMSLLTRRSQMFEYIDEFIVAVLSVAVIIVLFVEKI